jgi:hypothetical protein
VFGVVLAALTLFVIVDALYGVRERANRAAAYAPTPVDVSAAEYERSRNAIETQIGLLLKPREGKLAIGGDPSARLIEAGILYGRLALLEERRGNGWAAKANMAKGVELLRSANHPTASEDHIREVIAKQELRQSKR